MIHLPIKKVLLVAILYQHSSLLNGHHFDIQFKNDTVCATYIGTLGV